jgi:aflatoxin B1 aldehyde reductase
MTMSADAGFGQVKNKGVKSILTALVNSERAKVQGGGAGAQAAGSVLVDTARIYQVGTPDADTETVLGQVFAENPTLRDGCSIATKCHPIIAPHQSLSRQSVVDQCDASLSRLRAESVDLFYLHMPDIHTDMEDTLDGVAELHDAGKIKEFGLSNYPAWKMADIWHRCQKRGMILPTVYQGMYNGITRDFEREVVPMLREFGMRAYMYNPLAGGLLTGRYATISDLTSAEEGRFSVEFDKAFGLTIKAGKMYQVSQRLY